MKPRSASILAKNQDSHFYESWLHKSLRKGLSLRVLEGFDLPFERTQCPSPPSPPKVCIASQWGLTVVGYPEIIYIKDPSIRRALALPSYYRPLLSSIKPFSCPAPGSEASLKGTLRGFLPKYLIVFAFIPLWGFLLRRVLGAFKVLILYLIYKRKDFERQQDKLILPLRNICLL